MSPDWKANVGNDKAVEWPVGIGAKGNEGVAATVQQTANSIGYVEYAYAKQNKMTYANMVNKDGKTVAPTSAAFAAAAANADWKSVPGYGVILANEAGAETWPITAATFILMYKQPKDPAASAEALKFFAWAYAKGDKMADDLAYIPMPDAVVKSVTELWAGHRRTRRQARFRRNVGRRALAGRIPIIASPPALRRRRGHQDRSAVLSGASLCAPAPRRGRCPSVRPARLTFAFPSIDVVE